MRFLFLFIFVFYTHLVFAQPYFARFYQFQDESENGIRDINLSGDSLLFRMYSTVNSNTNGTRVVSMPVNSTVMNEDIFLPNVGYGHSTFKDGDSHFLPSNDKHGLKFITLYRFNENFLLKDSIDLKLPGEAYNYYASKAILFNEKYIVTGTAQNSSGYAFGKTVIFIVNKDLTLYDTLVIPPARQLITPQDLAINPVDGKLYLSLVYDNFLPNDSAFVPAPKYQKIVRLDSNFHITNFWNSGVYSNAALIAAPIVFSQSGTMYGFYTHNSLDNFFSLDMSGQLIWKTPLDSFTVYGPTILWHSARPYIIRDIAVASNGDILAAGSVDEPNYNIGSSSLLARVSPTGVVKWIKIYRSNNNYSFQNYGYASDLTNVLELPDESIVAGGGVLLYDQILTPNTPPKLAPWLIRADSNGCISSDCGFIQDAVQKTTYFPIVSPSNEWTVEYSDFSFNTRRKYRFSLDSVFVNGYFHRELEYNDSFTGFHTTGRYYREKDGIVYNSFGHVLYNLNLGATDTLPSNQNLNPSTRTILSVGTVVLNDGLPRKTMKFQCDDEPIDTLTIVEGIGDLGEFFHAELQCINPLDGSGKTINCFSVNGEIVYKRIGEDCDLISTSHPINSEKPIIVYPNPTNGLLYLNLSNIDYNQIMQVHIYSSLGTLKLRQDLVKTNGLFSIETSDLNDGIYLGQVILGDGQVIPFEFVVMR
jgi:Secretion system C-terminal sorting domain